MARLPLPGSDNGTWGQILNDFLLQTHKPDGILKDGSVSSQIVADGAITTPKLAAQSITAAQLAPGAVSTTVLQNNAVSGTKIADTTISEQKLDAAVQAKLNAVSSPTLGDRSINAIKLNAPTSPAPANGDVLVLDSTQPGGFKWQALSLGSAAPSGPAAGDLAGTYPNPTLKDGSVSTQKVQDRAITAAKLSPTTAPSANQYLTYDGTALVWANGPTATTQTQADWTEANTSSAAFIRNKPTIPSVTGTNTGDQTLSLSGSTITISGASGNSITLPTGSTGESNTASNIGTNGIGVYKQKTGVNLEFKKLNAASNKLSVVDNTTNNTVDLDINTANLGLSTVATSGSYADLSNKPTIPSALSALTTDVTITTPANGQVLTYDSTTSKWKNTAGLAAISTDATLGGASSSDTVISSQKAVKTYVDTSLSSTTGFVKNQYTAAQTADYWISGRARADGQLTLGGGTNQSQIVVKANASHTMATPHIEFQDSTGVERGRLTINNLENIALGRNAGGSLTTAQGTVAIGTHTLENATTAGDNVAVGAFALQKNTTGGGNTAAGNASMQMNTTGSGNSALGKGSLIANTIGSDNSALGKDALSKNTAGSWNVAIGGTALFSNTTGNSNTAVGTGALEQVVVESDNTAVGIHALRNTTVDSNTAVGAYTLAADTTGTANTAVGKSSLTANTTGNSNTALGTGSLMANVSGSYNTSVGALSLAANNLGHDNTAVGFQALNKNIGSSTVADAGSYNIAFGANALFANTTGESNTALGPSSLAGNTTGWANVGVGRGSLAANTTGFGNVGLGFTSLLANTTGINNVGLGYGALVANTTGNGNIGLGTNAAKAVTTSSDNIGVGVSSLQNTTTGSGNVGMGGLALASNTTGNNNLALGYGAGDADTGGAFKTVADIGGSTAIGHHAQVQDSNAIVIGAIDQPHRVGIGTTKPLTQFSVSPVMYSDGTAAVTTAGNVVTGTGTTWPSWIAGFQFIFANGQSAMITAVNSPTQLTLDAPQPVTTAQAYRVHIPAFNVTSSGRVGVHTTSPVADLHVQGTSYTDRADAAWSIQHGRNTSTTGTTYNGQWTRLMSISITQQFGDIRTMAMLTSVGDSGYMDRVMIDVKVKQQNVMGQPPAVTTLLSNALFVAPQDVSAVVTENTATKTTVELWMRIQRTYQAFNIVQIMNTGGNAEWQTYQAFQPSLPTGTVVASVYAPGQEEWVTTVPATATSPGIKGQKAYDATYQYICIADNTWRRTALTSW